MAARVEIAASGVPRTTLRAELRALSSLALPLAISQAGQALMGLVDTAVVGRAGPLAFAGTALGSNLYVFISIMGQGAMLGLDPLISQAMGAGQPVRARRMLWQGVWMALLVTAVLVPFLGILQLGLEPFGIAPEVATQARRFLWWRMVGLPPALVFVAARAYLQAVHRVKVLAWSTLAANLLNFVFDLLLVFGGASLPAWTGPLRAIPPLGAGGAALASTLCTFFQLALVAAVCAKQPLSERPVDLRQPRPTDLKHALRVGLPVSLHLGAEVGVFSLAGFLAGSLGTTDIAAHQVALALCSLSFTFALGFGNAGAVRVGLAVGGRDTPRARLAGFTALGCGVAIMASAALLFWLIPDALAQLMTNEPEVRALAIPLLAVAAVFQLSDGIQGVGAGVLRGAGDSRFTFVANMLGHYGVGLPLSLFLGFKLKLGVVGIWWGLCAGLTCVAGALFFRFWNLSRQEIHPLVDGA